MTSKQTDSLAMSVNADFADKKAGRISINIWGDILLDGRAPIVRRVLCERDARECMYSWVYLNEIVSLREILTELADAPVNERESAGRDIFEMVEKYRGSASDPQYQISQEIVQIFAPLAAAVAAVGEENIEFCELGSTFYSSIDKLQLNLALLGLPAEMAAMRISAVEDSPFMQRSARFLHPGREIHFANDWRSWRPEREKRLHLSRFVASYAMGGTDAFVEWLDKFDVLTITDVFNLARRDCSVWDLGLPMIFLDFSKIVDRLNENDWSIFLTDVHPDYHAPEDKQCFVARIFGIRRELAERCGYFELISKYPELGDFLRARPLGPGDGLKVIEALATELPAARWAEVRDFKRTYPIWGRVPEQSGGSIGNQGAEVGVPGISVVFEHPQPQIVAAVNEALAKRGLGPDEPA